MRKWYTEKRTKTELDEIEGNGGRNGGGKRMLMEAEQVCYWISPA